MTSVKQTWLMFLLLTLALFPTTNVRHLVIALGVALDTECESTIKIMVDTITCVHPCAAPVAEAVVMIVVHHCSFLCCVLWEWTSHPHRTVS